MLSILLPCRTFTVVFWCLISFLQEVSYSERTHSLHCYLHAVYSLTLPYFYCRILMLHFIPSVGKLFWTYSLSALLLTCCLFSYPVVVFWCLISFLQRVSYSELTHSRHYYLHAVYSLTLPYLHCRLLMLNLIPSVGKLFWTNSLSALSITCCLFSYPVVPSLSYFDA